MTQTASSKDHFFSKSTEDEKHSEGELRSKCEKAPIDCMPDMKMGGNYAKLMELLMIAVDEDKI
jgi:hypothetical protein